MTGPFDPMMQKLRALIWPHHKRYMTRFALLQAQLIQVQEQIQICREAQSMLLANQEQLAGSMKDAGHQIDAVAAKMQTMAEAAPLQICIERGQHAWRISPDAVPSFRFRDGDKLRVLPHDRAASLPCTWGDVIVPLSDGGSIRVPPRFHDVRHGRFRLPAHLVSLTGAGGDTLDLIGKQHIANFKRHVGLEPSMTILEVGSGIGRDALQLLDYLDSDGAFIGTDITRDSIVWCQDNISATHPNFTFYHTDAFSELYNPFGSLDTTDIVLPAADRSVDRVVLSSVFTHLLANEVEHYLHEFRRVLKPEGRVYSSFFHLTPEALAAAKTKGNTAWQAKFDLPLGDGAFANDPDFPRGAVGFTTEATMRMIEAAGLELVRPFLRGWWSGLHGDAAEDGQDVMILKPRG